MAAILDLIETGIAPFDSQTQKALPYRTEHEVNRDTVKRVLVKRVPVKTVLEKRVRLVIKV